MDLFEVLCSLHGSALPVKGGIYKKSCVYAEKIG